jgi:putative tryptophan/tyrosine transport system substrate-binding protein
METPSPSVRERAGVRVPLLALLAVFLLAAPLAAEAQAPAKVPRIGFLSSQTPAVSAPYLEAFRQGLRELGYVEGQNIAIEYRFSEGRPERLPALAAELVRLKVDVIVTTAPPAAPAAKQATSTIPIVFTSAIDPVASGLVASLAQPGGNITGLATMFSEVVGKHLELLKEVAPKVSRVAVLQGQSTPVNTQTLRQAEGAARTLGLQLLIVQARTSAEIDTAFAAMRSQRVGGVLVLRDTFFFLQRTQIVALAAKSQLPVVYGFREDAEAGGLMAYGASIHQMWRRAATYVDKILKGAKPADLPVEQPTKFELVINLKTAKALGLTIPPSLLQRADEVIQ